MLLMPFLYSFPVCGALVCCFTLDISLVCSISSWKINREILLFPSPSPLLCIIVEISINIEFLHSRFVESILTHACVHLGQCRILALALLLPEEGQKPALFLFGPSALCSPWSQMSLQFLSEPSLCKSICCSSFCLNPGVLPASLDEVSCRPCSDTTASNPKPQSEDRQQFGNSVM